jgi:hypothetical protein
MWLFLAAVRAFSPAFARAGVPRIDARSAIISPSAGATSCHSESKLLMSTSKAFPTNKNQTGLPATTSLLPSL